MTQGQWDNQGDTNYITGKPVPIGDLNDTLEVTVPIGGIIPWAKTITGVPSLPACWKECDGTNVSDANSPLNGQATPNLNGANAFLRGSTTSGGTGGAATHAHSVTASARYYSSAGSGMSFARHGHTHTVNSSSNVPPFMDVVFIMRIK